MVDTTLNGLGLRYAKTETIRLLSDGGIIEIKPTGMKQSGLLAWQEEEIKWHVEADVDFPEESILTLESDLLPHGWSSRVVNLGSELDLDEIFVEWPRPSTL